MPGRNAKELLRMVDYVERGGTAFVLAAAQATVHALQDETPEATRHAKSAYTAGVGAPAAGFPEVSKANSHSVPVPVAVIQAGAAGFKLGDDLVVGNRAGHSAIIAGGRRVGSHGRMLGSTQAPEPYVPKAVATAQQVMKGWRFAA